MVRNSIVIIINAKCKKYPKFPYNPPRFYPELKKLSYPIKQRDRNNCVYEQVRNLFKELGLDLRYYGKKDWNPLGEIIKPGETVLLKPNMVNHLAEKDYTQPRDMLTHPSIIRVIIDYVLLALKGQGKIIIGDAPQGNGDFLRIVKIMKLDKLLKWYHRFNIQIELIDFRKYIYPQGFVDSMPVQIDGDPNGYTLVNLGKMSFLNGLKGSMNFYGSDYDREFVVKAHSNPRKHLYLISKTVLESDVIINIPKLKTHKKTGVTISLKNLVGINGDKRYLPHYRVGTPSLEGDAAPDSKNVLFNLLQKWDRFSRENLLRHRKKLLIIIYKIIERVIMKFIRFIYRTIFNKYIIYSGNWYGNDTTWRMVLDLNIILLYANRKGKIKATPQRKLFNIVDGIIGGEGEGPMGCKSKPIGLVAAGSNSFLLDYILSYIMGFDPKKIKMFSITDKKKRLFLKNKSVEYFFKNVKVINKNKLVNFINVNLGFSPPEGWKVILREK